MKLHRVIRETLRDRAIKRGPPTKTGHKWKNSSGAPYDGSSNRICERCGTEACFASEHSHGSEKFVWRYRRRNSSNYWDFSDEDPLCIEAKRMHEALD